MIFPESVLLLPFSLYIVRLREKMLEKFSGKVAMTISTLLATKDFWGMFFLKKNKLLWNLPPGALGIGSKSPGPYD